MKPAVRPRTSQSRPIGGRIARRRLQVAAVRELPDDRRQKRGVRGDRCAVSGLDRRAGAKSA